MSSRERTCEQCGASFSVKYQSSPVRFCSRNCAASTHRAPCGESNPNWRGGKTKHPLYQIYLEMIGRCHRPTHKRYADYGGRGITVCDAWRTDFWAFVNDMGPRPDGVGPTSRALWSLDRIDNNLGYELSNCRWANHQQQAKNRRRFGYESRQRDSAGRWVAA